MCVFWLVESDTVKNQLMRRKGGLEHFHIQNPRTICMDNSMEFLKACEELKWNHERSTPRRSETRGIA